MLSIRFITYVVNGMVSYEHAWGFKTHSWFSWTEHSNVNLLAMELFTILLSNWTWTDASFIYLHAVISSLRSSRMEETLSSRDDLSVVWRTTPVLVWVQQVYNMYKALSSTDVVNHGYYFMAWFSWQIPIPFFFFWVYLCLSSQSLTAIHTIWSLLQAKMKEFLKPFWRRKTICIHTATTGWSNWLFCYGIMISLLISTPCQHA